MRRSAVVVVLGMVAVQLVLGAGPAYACSCRADVLVADALAQSDGAFVGVFAGRADPFVHGPLISSGRPVLNHFVVERSVKGDIGETVDVEAAAGGASCGLELQVGQRTGLLLQRTEAGWRSSLCSQTAPEGLLVFAPAGAPVTVEPSSSRGLLVGAGVVALAGLVLLVIRRKS